MRAVVQRVTEASVSIDGACISHIRKGLLVLLGIADDDLPADAIYMCAKILGLRIFDDENGVSNLDVCKAEGEILLVSQFTLLGDARKGRRPSYIAAARPEKAIPLYQMLKELLEKSVPVATGRFGADMDVLLHNDGPFTILLDSRKEF